MEPRRFLETVRMWWWGGRPSEALCVPRMVPSMGTVFFDPSTPRTASCDTRTQSQFCLL